MQIYVYFFFEGQVEGLGVVMSFCRYDVWLVWHVGLG